MQAICQGNPQEIAGGHDYLSCNFLLNATDWYFLSYEEKVAAQGLELELCLSCNWQNGANWQKGAKGAKSGYPPCTFAPFAIPPPHGNLASPRPRFAGILTWSV